MVRLFPVQILAGGLRCYDGHGRYHVVSWTDISHVQLARMYGLPYLLIASPRAPRPLTLPLWLDNMAAFVDLAEREGGSDNALVKALRAAA